MQVEYLGIVVLVAVAALICGAMVTLSWVLGPKNVTPYKGSPYECGVTPVGDTHERFPIKFYLVAIIFILFDIEVVFLWPWMTTFLGAASDYLYFSFFAFLIYMALWILGDVYALRVGAFDWDEATSLDPAKLGSGVADGEITITQHAAMGVGGGVK
jgi:NADH-quinone oxidoreductase subunit A